MTNSPITAYRTSEQERIQKEIVEMDEAAQYELDAALNKTLGGKPLIEHDPVILHVAQQTLKERLELENVPVVEEEKSLYSRIKEKMPSPKKIILPVCVGVGLLGYGISQIPAVRSLYDVEYAQIYTAENALEKALDYDCDGDLSSADFLNSYSNLFGEQYPEQERIHSLQKEDLCLSARLGQGDAFPRFQIRIRD